MSSNVRERIDELETLVLDKPHTIDSLSGVPFVVFPYDPEKELSVEDDIDDFVEKLEFNDLSLRESTFEILYFRSSTSKTS